MYWEEKLYGGGPHNVKPRGPTLGFHMALCKKLVANGHTEL